MRTPSLFAIIFAVGFGACDREHPARTSVTGFLDAVQYGDRDRAYGLHIDSTSMSAWCAPEFARALKKAQNTADGDECRRVRGLSNEQLDALPDDVRLVVQITGWACENKDATCSDYARTVFEQAWETHPLVRGKPTGYKVRKVFGEGARAVAYVDLQLAAGKTEHRTLELVKNGDDWLVSDGFLRSQP